MVLEISLSQGNDMNTAYSKYRKPVISEGRKSLIYVAIVALLWVVVNEMDYREIEQQRCEQVA